MTLFDRRCLRWLKTDPRAALVALALLPGCGSHTPVGMAAPGSGPSVPDAGRESPETGTGGGGGGDGQDAGSASLDASNAHLTSSGDTGVDAGTAPPSGTCLGSGLVCSVSEAGVDPCCANSCTPDTDAGSAVGVPGHCGGCVAEGADCVGGVACCDGLDCVTGRCGTSACVPDGTPCGSSAPSAVCCNDDCNGTTCGGV